MKVKVKKLIQSAQLPRYATDGSGCFDLFTPFEIDVERGNAFDVSTGLAFEVPEGHVMLVYSRSGHGFKHGIRLANGTGVIDSDYRGEVRVALHMDRRRNGGKAVHIPAGGAIAQACIIPVPRVEFEETDELTQTERGEDGFGSTDAQPVVVEQRKRGRPRKEKTAGFALQDWNMVEVESDEE